MSVHRLSCCNRLLGVCRDDVGIRTWLEGDHLDSAFGIGLVGADTDFPFELVMVSLALS